MRRGRGLLRGLGSLRVPVRGLPERWQVAAEVQFKVAGNAVTDIANLRSPRLRAGEGQQREAQVIARLKLGSAWRPKSIDLGLRRGQHLAIERGQTPDESIDKRVEIVIVQRAVHPTVAFGDIGLEIVASQYDLQRPRAADQAREPFQRSPA